MRISKIRLGPKTAKRDTMNETAVMKPIIMKPRMTAKRGTTGLNWTGLGWTALDCTALDWKSQKQTGYGFVTFESAESMNEALQHPTHMICGKEVVVYFASGEGDTTHMDLAKGPGDISGVGEPPTC